MRYCVIDLECTCWANNDLDKQFHETIEIGAALLNESFDIIKATSIFVRPTFYPQLSTYCTQLTGISQEDVDHAPLFNNAIQSLLYWVEDFSDIILCSWGEFDKNQLKEDCTRYGCVYPFNANHINIKQLYIDKLHHKKAGLSRACRTCGIPFEGTPHRGVDDALMASKIFKLLNTSP